MTFGLWWGYFSNNFGDMLHLRRERSFVFGYGHIIMLGAVAASGAGLHVAAMHIEGTAKIGVVGAVLALVIPLGIALLAL